MRAKIISGFFGGLSTVLVFYLSHRSEGRDREIEQVTDGEASS